MTRQEISKHMARAAWQASDEPEPWDELPAEVRDEWIGYQRAALDELERLVPAVGVAIDGAAAKRQAG